MTMKKSLIALSVAAAPLASQAGLEPMNDAEMGNITGKESVRIELQTAMTIDQLEYSQDTNGSFVMDDIRVGGHEPGETLDVQIDIDLMDSGDAEITVLSIGPLAPVELGVDVGGMGLHGDDGSATLISDLSADVLVSQLQINARVDNIVGDNEDTGSIEIENRFAIENLDVDFDVAAVSLEGMRMAGPDALEDIQEEDPDWTPIAITDGAQMNMQIGAGSRISDPGGDEPDALRINVDEFAASIWMPTVNVGGESIGSVAIDNLNVTESQMAIYGR